MHGQGSISRRALAALTVAGLAGCALPDQRTFGVAPYRPPAPPPTAAAQAPPPPPWPGPSPLVTIRFANLTADYATPLGDAVRAAEQRKPDVVFVVVGVAPAAGDPAAQQAAAAGAAKSARAVLQAIAGLGVPTDRLLLATRTDPTVKAEQVEVYVR